MTTNEFIKAVENLGYEAEKDEGCITITYKNKVLAHVFINELYRMSSYFSKTGCVENAGVLFALIFQYAITPIKDREEEKKFYLKHRWFMTEFGDKYYLCKCYNEVGDISYVPRLSYITHDETWLFTLKEIEEIKEKFDTDLSDYELVKVKDEKV